jgi:heme/copper-type cytochrome/quinol oxidase subunit 2
MGSLALSLRGKSARDGTRTATRASSLPGRRLPAVIFIAIAVMGQRVWAQLHLNEAPPDAVHIEVTGQQFVWNFRYPGADGKFGRNDPSLYNDEDNSPTARPWANWHRSQGPRRQGRSCEVGLMVVPVIGPWQ